MVWTDPVSATANSVRQMLIDTPTGQRVQLADVADVGIRPTPNVVKREASSRRIDVQANVKGPRSRRSRRRRAGAFGEVVVSARLFRSAARRVSGAERRPQAARAVLPPGARRHLCPSARSLLTAGRLAALSFVTLPLGTGGRCVGGVAGREADFLARSLVGFLTVLGIAARNGIIMINHFQHLER